MTVKQIDNLINKIIYGDAIEVMKEIDDESVDLVVTDPPYNSQIEWDKKNTIFHRLALNEIYRVLKRGGSLYYFFAPLNSYHIEGLIRSKFIIKNKLVWWHRNLFGANLSYGNDRYKSTCKGNSKHNVSQKSYHKFGSGFDVIQMPAITKNKLHRAQKPLELIERFVYNSSNEGDVVLDPFIGSGTTAIACKMMNRKFIGIDNDMKTIETARKRLEKINSISLKW